MKCLFDFKKDGLIENVL